MCHARPPLDKRHECVVFAGVLPSLLRLLILLLVSAASAAGQLVFGDWGYTNISQGRPPTNLTVAVITNYIGAPGIATVPALIGTNQVRTVGGGSASIDPQSRLTGIVLPDSVTTIGQFAFYGSTNIASVTFGTGILTIDYAAFGESGLTSVTVPDSVTTLGTYAFYKMPRLTNATFGSGITNIGLATFSDSTNLRSVALPPGLKAIGEYAFANNRALTNTAIPLGVTNIGRSAFGGCTNLLAAVIPDAVLSIGREAFKECAAMTNIVLGAGVTNIAFGAFAYCDGLVSVAMPPGVTNVVGGLFYQSASLQSVTFGSGVVSIGDFALGDCPSLRSVLFKGNPPVLSGVEQNVFGNSTNAVFVMPQASGWGATFAGRPTMFFMPQAAAVASSESTFSFAWTGTGDIAMDVQRRTSLVDGVWSNIATGVTAGVFVDPATPEGSGYYRAILP